MREDGFVTDLTRAEVEQLVSLRMGLDAALSQSSRAGRYERGAAIVALDAVIERASALVAVSRGLTVPIKLEDLIARLKQSLDDSWTPGVLPDIKQLRRARNAAQHDGLEPDRDLVPVWASAVAAYVGGLIDAQYAVDISRVVIADAIRDPQLRSLIENAETARVAGQYRRALDLASTAYSEASSQWSVLRTGGRFSRKPFHSEIVDSKAYSYVQGELDALNATFDASVFSGSGADAEWFTNATRERGDVFDAADAERAITFVFQWISGYESAAATWTTNRLDRANRASRRVRADDKPAHIAECISVEMRFDRIEAILRIDDVPADDDFDTWARVLAGLLRTSDIDVWRQVHNDGTIELTRPVASADQLASDVLAVDNALVEADVEVSRRKTSLDKSRRDVVARKDAYESSIDEIRHHLPVWVEQVGWSNDEAIGGDEGVVLLTIADEVMKLRLGEANPKSQGSSGTSLADAIREHPLVEQCFTGRAGVLCVMPVLDVQHLQEVLDYVGPEVQVNLEASRVRESERQSALVASRAAIAATVASLRS